MNNTDFNRTFTADELVEIHISLSLRKMNLKALIDLTKNSENIQRYQRYIDTVEKIQSKLFPKESS